MIREKAKKKMMDSSEIEVIKIKDEVTEFCEVQTKIKSGNEFKFKKKMIKMNEIFEFQNGIELIDQLDIPVNNEIQEDLEQGNLFRGIDNCSGAWYKGFKSLGQRDSISFFQLEKKENILKQRVEPSKSFNSFVVNTHY